MSSAATLSQVPVARLIKVPMAGVGLGRAPETLETLLGSCVGIALWDPTTGYGGLAHVLLPDSLGSTELPGKFADTAVAYLKRELQLRGANANALVAKLTGGATMFGVRTTQDVGRRNAEAAQAQLAQHRIRVVATHLGGEKGRVIRCSLTDGRIGVFIGREKVAEI